MSKLHVSRKNVGSVLEHPILLPKLLEVSALPTLVDVSVVTFIISCTRRGTASIKGQDPISELVRHARNPFIPSKSLKMPENFELCCG